MVRNSGGQKELLPHFSHSERTELSTCDSIAGNKGETKYSKMKKHYENLLPTNLPKKKKKNG